MANLTRRDVTPFMHTPGPVRSKRVLGAAAIGNVLEWYDWGAYGFLVTYIGANFFPSGDSAASLLLTFATFGVGFVARPFGAVALGWIGDRYGRRIALLVTLFGMTAATVSIGCIPGHGSIGKWAPFLLVACRLLQGFSTGGELGGSLTFMIEWAPPNRRGFYGSAQQASTIGGVLLGSALAALLNALLTFDQMDHWGWRLPFLFGGLFLPIGFWLRRQLKESPIYLSTKQSNAPPPTNRTSATRVLQAMCLVSAPVACQYLLFTFLPTYSVKFGGLTQTEALWSNAIGLIFVIVFTPLMGALSDRIGRKPLLFVAEGVFLLSAYFIFRFVSSMPGFVSIVLLQIGLGMAIALYHGASPAAVAELFTTRERSFLLSISYSVSVALSGGFAPFLASWLIAWTGSSVAPAFYLIASVLVTGIALIWTDESAHRPLG